MIDMLSISDLKVGTVFIHEKSPWQVLEVRHIYVAQGNPCRQTKIKNLINGRVLSKTFKPADQFEEAEIEYQELKYIYHHRGMYHFCHSKNPSQRFAVEEAIVGNEGHFLKKESLVRALFFEDKIRSIDLPIKIELEVIEAPPNIKGNSAQSLFKMITLETGVQIKAPLFIEAGDIVRVNTKTGDYVERTVKK